jgi:hypothetical protein
MSIIAAIVRLLRLDPKPENFFIMSNTKNPFADKSEDLDRLKATCIKFKDGHALFLESQAFVGGCLMLSSGMKKKEAIMIRDALNAAIEKFKIELLK